MRSRYMEMKSSWRNTNVVKDGLTAIHTTERALSDALYLDAPSE